MTRIPILVLMVHPRCDCRCQMCDIWMSRSDGGLTPGDLRRQLPAMRRLGVEQVLLSGGEPLLNPDFEELCRILLAEGIELRLATTGLALARHAAVVAETIAEVYVSVDGPPEVHDRIRRVDGAWAQVAVGVAAVKELAPRLTVIARVTIQKDNVGSLLETARAARQLGVDRISFLAADVSATAFGRTGSAKERVAEVGSVDLVVLGSELRALAEDDFVVESAARLASVEAHFRAVAGLQPFVAPACVAPWVSAVVETDGRVRPCFFHEPLGDWSDGLDHVLESSGAVRFRAELDVASDETCRRCVCSLKSAE